MSSLFQTIRHNAIGLGLFATVTAGLIAVTQVSTADKIAEAEKRARSAALLEIFPASSHDNDLLADSIQIPPSKLLGTRTPTEAFIAKRDNQPIGIILTTVSSEGYSGEIWSLVGIDHQGVITGVRVVSHKETPGLGDKIEARKSNWIYGFNQKSLENPAPEGWKVEKDGGEFDQFAGATITPRAVVESVKNALVFFSENRDMLFSNSSLEQESAAHGH